MEIKINGKPADIKPESEKTIGEILSALEQWLTSSGHRLSGIAIDGQMADSGSVEEYFSRDIDTIDTLDLYTSTLSELCVQSLLRIHGDIEEYENLDYSDKRAFCANWERSPQAHFAAEQMPDFYALCAQVFAGAGATVQMLRDITEERLREIENPVDEFTNLQTLVNETCARLIDLPLDIQTGKDRKAAQTIQIFSGITEKIFRIFKILTFQGFSSESIADIISEFDASVKELLAAYERHDTVLVGDIAEYEMAPKLQKLYDAIKDTK